MRNPLPSFCALVVLASCAPQSELKNPAPRFRGKSYDGKHYSLFDLSKGGTVFVKFLTLDDPEAPAEIGRLRWLRQENPGLRIVALVQAEEKELWLWCREHEKAWEFDKTVPILSDQFAEFIGKFGAKQSGEAALVGPNTEIIAEGLGIGEAENAAMKAAGLKGYPPVAKGTPPEFKF